MMIKICGIVSVILFTLQLDGFSQTYLPSIQFNAVAKASFARQYSSINLAPLDASEQCYFRKIIENDLDSFNGTFETIVNDKFEIKDFYTDFLDLSFGFVYDLQSKSMNFIALPELDDFIINVEEHYDKKSVKNNLLKLKGARRPIRINSDLFTKFLEKPEFILPNEDRRDFYAKEKLAHNTLKLALPSFFYFEVQYPRYLEMLNQERQSAKLAKEDYDFAMNLIGNIETNKTKLSSFYRIDSVGYVMLVFTRNSAEAKLELYIYILPDPSRMIVSGFDKVAMYEDCK